MCEASRARRHYPENAAETINFLGFCRDKAPSLEEARGAGIGEGRRRSAAAIEQPCAPRLIYRPVSASRACTCARTEPDGFRESLEIRGELHAPPRIFQRPSRLIYLYSRSVYLELGISIGGRESSCCLFMGESNCEEKVGKFMVFGGGCMEKGILLLLKNWVYC